MNQSVAIRAVSCRSFGGTESLERFILIYEEVGGITRPCDSLSRTVSTNRVQCLDNPRRSARKVRYFKRAEFLEMIVLKTLREG